MKGPLNAAAMYWERADRMTEWHGMVTVPRSILDWNHNVPGGGFLSHALDADVLVLHGLADSTSHCRIAADSVQKLLLEVGDQVGWHCNGGLLRGGRFKAGNHGCCTFLEIDSRLFLLSRPRG